MNCPECRSRNVADKSYTPMGTQWWRAFMCRDCGWEDHRPENGPAAAARVMNK